MTETKSVWRSLGESVLSGLWLAVCRIYQIIVITKVWALLIMGFMGLPALPLTVAFGIQILWSFLSFNPDFDTALATTILIKEKASGDEKLVLKWVKRLWPAVFPSIIWLSAFIWSLLLPLL